MISRAHIALLPLAILATAGAAETKTTLSRETPFASRATVAAQAQANETIEFAGISVVGKRTDLIFHDKTTKKNHWIAKGETKEGITVLNYDERREEVVVKINGTEKTLPLRKATGANGPKPVSPMPTGFNVPTSPTPLPGAADLVKIAPPPPPVAPQTAPANTTPAAPATPEAQAQQKAETEARMLVSDLLEIGMAQRKAYEEQQRRAAQGGDAPQTQQTQPQPGTQTNATNPVAPKQ